MNDRSDISSFEALIGKISRQNDAIVFADFHFLKG